MDLSDYEVPRVLVTCRSDENENIPLYYHVVDNFQIQFGREEFCLVTGLKFGVENWTDCNNAEELIPFRRRVFSSSLDGQPIRGKNVETLIKSEAFNKLDDNDAVSLCCVGILQLVLLGLEDRRHVPNWILRLANDREGWDKYPWGSHVWPTLYQQLKDANVKRWPALYATQPTDEIDKKSYSITGFAWAFKTWILESFRAATNDYYTRYRRLPRIVAWSSKNKFYRNMLNPFLHGQLPVERLVPDEIEARSRWWVSSRAYFDGRNIEDERIPRHLNRNNYFEVPSEMYREFEEQRRGYKQMMEKSDDMYEKMSRFMEDMRVGPVPQANKEPIIADQHYGISDLSEFQSNQGVPSSFHTLPNSNSFFNMATPSNWQTPIQSNWQTPNPLYLGTPNSQPLIPSHPGTSNWQNPVTSYSLNLPPPIPSHHHDAGLLIPNICDRARREHQPSVYMLSPYTVLPPTTVLPKKRTDKTKKKGKAAKLSPLNLGNTFVDENVSGEDVTITGVQQTDNYFFYENVDPDKGYKVPSFFWPQLVPHLCTYRSDRSWPDGWLSGDHMNSWIQILIRERAENDNWTLSKSGTICLHQENNRFMILTDPHNIRTLDGSVRPFPSWNDVTWVYMPINGSFQDLIFCWSHFNRSNSLSLFKV
ncbi:phospholipase-like protein [Tanacetum coccineum]|uniref:Phospholipase-like protein n=1 Tax=Tanacetum coccineum TaxID=301880 RepID=A0ABQ5EHG3_9ASTR